jgi:hypothetical protein
MNWAMWMAYAIIGFVVLANMPGSDDDDEK